MTSIVLSGWRWDCQTTGSFIVSQSYREWLYTNQHGDRSSGTIPEQLNRWLVFLEQWERALDTGMEVRAV